MPRKNLKYKKRKRGHKMFFTHVKRTRTDRGSQGARLCMKDVHSNADVTEEDCSFPEPTVPARTQEFAFMGFDAAPWKPPIRVLSLFDGLSTALLVLEKLKIKVDAYFSSEIDENALEVQRFTFQGRVTPVGSVLLLTPDKLRSFGTINLLIGGSPCTDLSLCNPKRRGLHGQGSSGELFFEYVRILDFLQAEAAANSTPFYHLFENTAHMEKETLLEMNRGLRSKPVPHFNTNYLPAHRKRYLWGNVLHMSSSRNKVFKIVKIKLSDILSYNREPNVEDVPTLTTSVSSQRSGPAKILPVQEGGKNRPLYIAEVEQLFGFPPHFTGGTNLSITDRWKLLGKAFSVPVFRHVLMPLQEVFMENSHETLTYGPPDLSL